MAGGNKSVRLFILGNNKSAMEKMEAVDVRAEELASLHPEMSIGFRDAAAMEKMAIMRGELRAVGKQAEETGIKIDFMGHEATVTSEGMQKAWEVTKLALLGVGGALGFGIYKAAGFQQQIELIHTQAGVSQSKLGALGDGVLKLAGQVGQGPDSLAESLYHVESAFSSMGISGPKALSLVKIASEGARVGNANLVDVTNALGAAIASGIPGVQNYGQAMGALNAIVGSGDMHMQDLADAMGTGMLAVVKGFGLSLNDVGAALATFGDNNIRGQQAATDLRMSVQALAAPAKAGQEQLKAWGLSSGALADDMRKHGLLSALQHLHTLFEKNGVTAKEQGQVITDMFGKKAGSGINVLMDQLDRLKSKYPEMEKGAKGFGAAWDATNNTVQQQFADLKSGSEALAIGLGEKLLPASLSVLKGLTGFVNALEHGSVGATALAGVVGTVLAGIALKKLEEGVKGGIEGFEGLWKGGSKVAGMAKDLAVKLGILKTAQVEATVATEGEAVAQEGVNAAFAISPIGLIVIGLIAVGVAFYELWKHSAAFRNFWIDAWKDIHHWFDIARHAISLGFDHMRHTIADFAHNVAAHFDEFRHEVAHVVNDVVHWLGVAVKWFEALPGKILTIYKDAGMWLFDAGKNIVMGLIHGIEGMGEKVWSSIMGLGHGLVSKFASALGMASPSRVFMEHGKNIVLGLVSGIDGYAHLAENSVRGLAQRSIHASSGRFYGAAGHGGGALTVEWIGGGGADQEFITWLKKQIRFRGGDPGVLGR